MTEEEWNKRLSFKPLRVDGEMQSTALIEIDITLTRIADALEKIAARPLYYEITTHGDVRIVSSDGKYTSKRLADL